VRKNDARVAATAVVIDSNPLRQRRIKRLLPSQGIQVVGMSSVVERAAEFADLHRCDVLVVALGEEISAGTVFSVLRKAHRRCPDLVSVALVEQDDPAMVEAALAAGAFAAVEGSTSMEEIAVLAAAALAERQAQHPPESGLLNRARLTRREIEILRLVAEGRSNREVARLLWVTDQTVKFHLANTYRKLAVSNRFEASLWASARGLVREPACATSTVTHIHGGGVLSSRQQNGAAVAATP
jgi:DNA-binding NarL/FixJ family response regulator